MLKVFNKFKQKIIDSNGKNNVIYNKNKNKIIAIGLIVLISGGVLYLGMNVDGIKYYYDRTHVEAEVDKDDELNIYKTICLKKYIDDNRVNLKKVGLDINKPISSQKNLITGENFDEYFTKSAESYRKKINKFSKIENLYSKETVEKMIHSYAGTGPYIPSDKYRTFNETNKKINKMFGTDEKKVYSIFRKIAIAEKNIEDIKDKIQITNKEIEDYISKHKDELVLYEYSVLEFDTEEDARGYYNMLSGTSFDKVADTYKKDKKLSKLAYKKKELLDYTDLNISMWLVEHEREIGDKALINSNGKFYIIQYNNKEDVINNRDTYINIDMSIMTNKKYANQLYELYKKGKYNFRKTLILDSSIVDKTNYNISKSYFSSKKFKEWFISEKYKNKDSNSLIFEEEGYSVIIFYNEKSENTIIKNHIINRLKDKYIMDKYM